MCDIVVRKFTFAISSPDEFLFKLVELEPSAGFVTQGVQEFDPQETQLTPPIEDS